jgi:hypothetical protein
MDGDRRVRKVCLFRIVENKIPILNNKMKEISRAHELVTTARIIQYDLCCRQLVQMRRGTYSLPENLVVSNIVRE